MAIIIGGMTQVSVQFNGQGAVVDGFQSVNWSINMQPNRLWQLGSWDPWRTQVGKTVSVSFTTYASRAMNGVVDPNLIQPITLSPSTTCENSNATARVIVHVDECSPAPVVDVDLQHMYLTSYSYAKGDAIGFGTESWSFQAWLASDVSGDFMEIPDPTYVLQGRAEGSLNGNVGDGRGDMGIGFVQPEGPHVVTGQQGSVSAGFPGVGNADTILMGLVALVGGGRLEADGQMGQSSATIPHQPLYIG
jgi:hypothetical protein